jgi:DNA-binding beta-propeller fold protein YncE
MIMAPITIFAHSDHAHPEGERLPEDLTSAWCPLQVIPGWGGGANSAVSSPAIGATHGGVVVDRDGSIYISSSRGVFVFSASGELLRSLEQPKFTNIHAMALREENGVEYIYAARNAQSEAIKFTTAGELVLRIGFPTESGVKGRFKPTAITVKPDGNILIADGYGTNQIFEFDAQGQYQSHFGGQDATDVEKFNTPHGITLDDRYVPARLLVADREKRRLVHFSLAGDFIAEVITGLRRPCAVSISAEGYVAVAELEGRVAVLDPNNALVGVLGNNPNQRQWARYKIPEAAWQPGVFTAPHGLSWDHAGNLYVQDWNAVGRVTKWVPLDR